MFQTIAVHHVKPEHTEAFLAFMREVEAAVEGAQGLIEFGSYREHLHGDLVAVARWESPAAFEAARPRIMSLSDRRRPEWTDREDDLLAISPA